MKKKIFINKSKRKRKKKKKRKSKYKNRKRKKIRYMRKMMIKKKEMINMNYLLSTVLISNGLLIRKAKKLFNILI